MTLLTIASPCTSQSPLVSHFNSSLPHPLPPIIATPIYLTSQPPNLPHAHTHRLLSRIPDLNDNAYSLLAAAAACGGEENISASDLSGLSLAAALSHAEQGVFYPHGGYDALEAVLVKCVRSAGGEVWWDVPIAGVVCEGEEEGKEGAMSLRAIGVRLGGGDIPGSRSSNR